MALKPLRPAPNAISSDARYRLLVEAVTDYAIYMLDPTGIVSSWNPGAERFKGYRSDEIIGEHFSRFYTDEDRAAGLPERALQTALKDGRFVSDGWRVRKDGTRFWASVVIDPIRDPAGGIIGFAKITRDLTERRAAEDDLRRSEERFRLLVQAVTDYAIYMLDPAGIVTNWNAGAERIKGYTRDEIVGQHFSIFYTEGDRQAGTPQHALDTAARDGRYEKEGWRRRKDGSLFLANVVIDPIRQDGRIIGFAKVTRDVTERAEAQAALDAAREQLFQAQKMEAVGQLTGGIAHDFNNLLTVIMGGLDIIRRTSAMADPKVTRAVSLALQGAQRAASLTSRLLSFSRRQPLNPTPIDLNVLIGETSELLHRTLGEDVELEGMLSPRLWPIEADQNQLESALLNLALNARDAMPNGGRLTLRTANVTFEFADVPTDLIPGDYASLAVIDTGTGMTADTLARAFEPFFTTKEVGRGSGLGLSMVYGFAKQSGGHATIESAEGRGTTVTLLFPRYRGNTAADPAMPPTDDTAPALGHGESVLVVEDHDEVRDYSVSVLTELGYTVFEAADADEALDLLATDERIDLLFTDVVLPGKSGRELADAAVALRPGLRTLFTTGYARDAIVHQGRLDPGVELLAKPFTPGELGARIRTLLDRRRDSGA